jgi:nucleoside-diphosphate-sugar epimerase
MRALLIGGTGFIGRYLTAALSQAGHSVALFHRGIAAVPGGVDEIKGDRNQLQTSVQAIRRFAPDVVIDLIVGSGPQAEDLMRQLRGITRRVVMLSSIDVYRAIGVMHGTESGPLQELPLTEDSALRRVLHPYPPENLEVMKAIFPWATEDYDKIPAEHAVMDDDEISGTVLRLPMVYGPGDLLHRFYPIVKRIMDGRRHILFPESVAAWRSPRGYVENVAAAIALASTKDRAMGRIYNVCEEPAFSELQWARKIAHQMQWDGEFVTLPVERTPRHLVRPGNAEQHWTASSRRIRSELGYEEPVALEEAIRSTIRWQRENVPSIAAFSSFDYAAEDATIRA